jgi:hypothetical protein
LYGIPVVAEGGILLGFFKTGVFQIRGSNQLAEIVSIADLRPLPVRKLVFSRLLGNSRLERALHGVAS